VRRDRVGAQVPTGRHRPRRAHLVAALAGRDRERAVQDGDAAPALVDRALREVQCESIDDINGPLSGRQGEPCGRGFILGPLDTGQRGLQLVVARRPLELGSRMADEPTSRKDKLLRLLSDVEPEARRLEELGQDIIRSARLARDMAAPLYQVVSQVPNDALQPDVCDRQIEGWRSWQDVAGRLIVASTTVNTFRAVSQVVANTCSSEFVVSSEVPLPGPVEVVVEAGKLRLRRTLDRTPLLDEARSSMQRLGLDSRGGGLRAPIDLLDEACGALEQPVVSGGRATSVLIPLRECIEAALSELLRRRPLQEPASKVAGKLTSIGRQCARVDLPPGHFERLGADGDILLNDLSSTKQADLPREQLSALFNRGLLFLNALMNSLEERRLKAN
jgi:hypothetical protein